jgi:hypothetical protein
VPVALIGVATAILGLLAIVPGWFWPVAPMVLILLGFSVMRAGANCHGWLDKLPEDQTDSTIAEHLREICELDLSAGCGAAAEGLRARLRWKPQTTRKKSPG